MRSDSPQKPPKFCKKCIEIRHETQGINFVNIIVHTDVSTTTSYMHLPCLVVCVGVEEASDTTGKSPMEEIAVRYTAARCGQIRGTEAPRQWRATQRRPAFVSPEDCGECCHKYQLNMRTSLNSMCYRNRKIV